MHWTPQIENLTDSYVRRALGTHDDEATPPVSSLRFIILITHSNDYDRSGSEFISATVISQTGAAQYQWKIVSLQYR